MHNDLPAWFLILALFLPRISLFITWMWCGWHFIPQPFAGLAWAFLPRLLVLLAIQGSMGYCPWFWIHLAVAVLVYLQSFSTYSNTPHNY